MPEDRPPIRRASTSRGDSVIGKVATTAEALLKDHWLADVSISSLAEKAGVVRASLLYQFKNGWPDVASTLVTNVLFRVFDEILIDKLKERSQQDVMESVTTALLSVVELAEQSGRLVANLRSQMFVWGDDNNELFHAPSQDFNEELAEVLALKVGPITDSHRYSAEFLINFALDMAAGTGLYPWTADERRTLIRAQVDLTISGLKTNLAGSDRLS